MTIHEVERKSGLDRSNIRFYEREGLLEPARRGNGYRDYSEEDLQLLLKIKLLRRLGFSLESIRALRQGTALLEEELEGRLDAIRAQRQEGNAAEQVCIAMRADGASFPTLDAQRYFRAYSRAVLPGEESGLYVPAGDRVRSASVPWRRFFARGLDLGLVEVLLCGVLALGFDVDLGALSVWTQWLLTFLVWALLLPLEALCISHWGATPGKALMGITVLDEEGRLLSFGRAAERAWGVFRYGEGCNIPIYTVYCGWQSYKEIKEGRGAEWDDRVTVTAKPYRHGRTVAYSAVCLALLGAVFLFSMAPYMPDNRGGSLTAAQFAENFNQLSALQDRGRNPRILLPDGTIVRMSARGEPVAGGEVPLQIDLRSGVVTGISYSRTDVTPPPFLPDREGKQVLRLVVRSWAWADANLFSAPASLPALEELMDHREGTLEREILGYRLTYSITPLEQAAGAGDTVEYQVLFRMSRMP